MPFCAGPFWHSPAVFAGAPWICNCNKLCCSYKYTMYLSLALPPLIKYHIFLIYCWRVCTDSNVKVSLNFFSPTNAVDGPFLLPYHFQLNWDLQNKLHITLHWLKDRLLPVGNSALILFPTSKVAHKLTSDKLSEQHCNYSSWIKTKKAFQILFSPLNEFDHWKWTWQEDLSTITCSKSITIRNLTFTKSSNFVWNSCLHIHQYL